MLLSVIIPTCHRNDLLAECLDRLAPGRQQGQASGQLDYEVIVTDDGQHTTAETMIREHYPWVRWLAGPRRGPAANRNHGAAQAGAPWLIFTDDDCLPSVTFLPAYRAAILESPSQVFEGRTEACGERVGADWECPANQTGGFLWSCNFAIQRDLFLDLGGFDQMLPAAAMEDVELRWRLEAGGQRIPFVPEALVHHPWRRRKGRAFLQLKARSIGYCVSKHPARRIEFTTAAQCRHLARTLLLHLPRNLIDFRGCGVFRQFALELLASYLFWRFVHFPKRPATSTRP